MKKKYFLLVFLIIILLIPILKPYIQDKIIYWRISSALTFPKKGYISEHPKISAKVTIEIKPYFKTSSKAPSVLNLNTIVDIDNNSKEELKSLIAAAKLNPKAASYTKSGRIQVVMHTPIDLPPTDSGSPASKTTFVRSTLLKTLTNIELEQLSGLLQEPVFIKIVHNDGVELIEVEPKVIMSIK